MSEPEASGGRSVSTPGPDRSSPDPSKQGGIFDMTGVTRGPDGVKRYDGLPRNLVQMLRASADRQPGAEAVVETGAENAGSPRLSYTQLWDRAARVAGGLRGLGVQRGDRVAIRLGNGADWVLAFFGAILADAIVVPVNTRNPGGKLLKRQLRDDVDWASAQRRRPVGFPL